MGSTKDAYDKGYGDGRNESARDKTWVDEATDQIYGNPNYKPDADHPEAWKQGYEQGKKDGK